MRRQHGVIARGQLLALGMDRSTIQRRLNAGRLHPVWRGVYAVGRPDLTAQGRWMAAVLTCGDGAVLSHASAAALWGIRPGKPPGRRERSADDSSQVHVAVPRSSRFRRRGIRVHRPALLGTADTASRDGIPATSPARTLIDLGAVLSPSRLEAAISRAGKEGLVAPEALRSALARCSSLHGAAAVRRVLEREDFVLADTELERLFVPLARRAGLPVPLTGRRVNGFEVDFFWPAGAGRRDGRAAMASHARPADERQATRPGPLPPRPDSAALHALAGRPRARVRRSDPPRGRGHHPQRQWTACTA